MDREGCVLPVAIRQIFEVYKMLCNKGKPGLSYFLSLLLFFFFLI